uniref:Uncharacterized protein n=1 Tax=Octactis speculum TaxID=3111310 RepID=A0A7S2HVW6_9STRA|mmetsp:Transcript_979/g.1233  ORF Transcript_979/g.1233 Transcript_979/m.1233 type:complete len:122 (+) Transcript_979:26-391(+)
MYNELEKSMREEYSKAAKNSKTKGGIHWNSKPHRNMKTSKLDSSFQYLKHWKVYHQGSGNRSPSKHHPTYKKYIIKEGKILHTQDPKYQSSLRRALVSTVPAHTQRSAGRVIALMRMALSP